jgi:hypothetical protein
LPSGNFDNARLAVLADALEEAGCPQDHEILIGQVKFTAR